mgnify:FL=1
MIEAKQGLLEIRETQKEYNKKIKLAPTKRTWNRLTNTSIDSKFDLEKAKFNAIKGIVQDYAVFGINLLSDEALESIRPKEESVGDEYRRELGT